MLFPHPDVPILSGNLAPSHDMDDSLVKKLNDEDGGQSTSKTSGRDLAETVSTPEGKA